MAPHRRDQPRQRFSSQACARRSTRATRPFSRSGFSTYQRYAAANLRVARRPAARVVIRTREGVAAAVNWLRDNGVPFAVRGGGHCYEAFSQNDAVVLDMRGMADVKIEDGGNRVSVDGGALLGQIYAALVDIGRIVPAGSCPACPSRASG
jgi:FAD/FMN-containing dehydrogenase